MEILVGIALYFAYLTTVAGIGRLGQKYFAKRRRQSQNMKYISIKQKND